MPFQNNSELPASVRESVPSKGGRDLFRQVVNDQLADGVDESEAFASAWAALKNAGFEQNDSGAWMRKAMGFKVGDRVEWQSSGGKARGVITQIVTDGEVPGIDGDVTVTGSEDEPAAQIQILDDDGERTDTTVGHKLSTLNRIEKAEFEGREVKLEKPFRLPEGSDRKFAVYVKDGDEVKRVEFGDPDMEIKRDDPEARANFRARFNCDQVTDKTSATYWSCKMWQEDTPVSDVLNKEYSTDMSYRQPKKGDGRFERAVKAVLNAAMGSDDAAARVSPEPEPEASADITGAILKADEDERIVYGWASVVTEKGEAVVDRQGDMIDPADMEKAAHGFMTDARMARAMHDGEGVGEVIHSLPLTKAVAESLGIETEREGWIIGMKIHDDDVWKRVKSGELAAFSIGGTGQREPVE